MREMKEEGWRRWGGNEGKGRGSEGKERRHGEGVEERLREDVNRE